MSRKIPYEVSPESLFAGETQHAHPRVWNVLRNQTFHGNALPVRRRGSARLGTSRVVYTAPRVCTSVLNFF